MFKEMDKDLMENLFPTFESFFDAFQKRVGVFCKMR